MKKCNGPCGLTLGNTEFNRDGQTKDGFKYMCKKCQSQYQRNIYKKGTGSRKDPKDRDIKKYVNIWGDNGVYM